MKVWILGSGSRGNATLVEHRGAYVLIDAGFGPRTVCRRLHEAGCGPERVLALFLTHEHLDHMRGARSLATRYGWPVYATRGTHDEIHTLGSCHRVIVNDDAPARVGDLLVETWRISHDAAEPVAYFITASDTGERAVVAYDLGYVSGGFAEACGHVDILIVESNHDEGMLRSGPYPPRLQARIAGPRGHLSNRAAGVLMRHAAARRPQHIVLAHLSETNNTPDVALGNARRALAGSGFGGTLSAAPQDAVCGPLAIS
jgi:phosphoribosyl 1,2-cyclic phosphodiesterase